MVVEKSQMKENVSRNIEFVRDSIGLTQVQFCDYMGVNLNTYRAIVQKVNFPNEEISLKISTLTGLAINNFWCSDFKTEMDIQKLRKNFNSEILANK